MLTLLLLPGMDGTGQLFQGFVEAMGEEVNAHVIAYPTNIALSYEKLLTFVESHIPVSEPFVILGESFSGPIAIQMAAKAPPELKGLILCCTFAKNPRPTLKLFEKLLPFMPLSCMPTPVLSRLLLGKFATPQLESDLLTAVTELSPAVLCTRLYEVLNVDVMSQLKNITVPCLYLRASYDRMVPRSASEIIQNGIQQTRVVPMNAPHCLLQAIPRAAAEVVKPFLRSLI